MDLTAADGIALAGLLIASVTDLREQKIYNWLTLPMVGAGVLLHAVAGEGLVFALVGTAAAFALHFGLWIAQVERAGDAKLAMGLGALLGWSTMLELSLWTLLILLPTGLLVLAIRGRLRNLVTLAHHVAARAQGVEVSKPPPLTFIAFGPTMAIGTVLARTTEWLHLW